MLRPRGRHATARKRNLLGTLRVPTMICESGLGPDVTAALSDLTATGRPSKVARSIRPKAPLPSTGPSPDSTRAESTVTVARLLTNSRKFASVLENFPVRLLHCRAVDTAAASISASAAAAPLATRTPMRGACSWQAQRRAAEPPAGASSSHSPRLLKRDVAGRVKSRLVLTSNGSF